jgi:ATP-binding cassette subfamily B multidrug efflux pump
MHMINPYISGSIVDDVVIGGKHELLWKLIVIMLSVVIAKVIIRYSFQMMFERSSQSSVKSIRENLFSRIQRLDFGYFDKIKTGDIMAQMTGDVDAVRHFVAWVIYQVFENVTTFILSIAVLFTVNWAFTLILLAAAPFIAVFARLLAVKVKPTFSRVREQFSRLNSVVQENIAGNRVVKAFAREDYEIERFERENAAFRERNLESAAVWGRYIPQIDFYSGAMGAILLLAGGFLIIRGSLTMGDLVIFSSLLWALSQPLRMAGWLINDYQRFVASLERLYALSRVEPRIVDPPAPLSPERIIGAVEFEGVGFSYGDEPVLEDLSFKAEPGMTVGILGPTGSGKSTIAKLLCRYYDATKGRILLDGRDVREYSLEALRRGAGMTMQDVFLFSDTIEGNIAFGNSGASMESVIEAARMAKADEFIRELPEGYDTIVGERGVGLSGGQRQRIALARLFLQDPPVMILDDTTSSVDVETEARIRESVRALHGKRTMIIIAHRISTIQHADLILVIKDGRIAERGTHEELACSDGYYREVWEHQSGLAFATHGRADTEAGDADGS